MIIENRSNMKDHCKIVIFYFILGFIDYLIVFYYLGAIDRAESTDKKNSHEMHMMTLFAFEVNFI